MESATGKTSNSGLGMHQDEPYQLLLKGGSATIQPGGSFDADDGRHVTFNASVKIQGGKIDKYNRYVVPAVMILELIDNNEAVAKLRASVKA